VSGLKQCVPSPGQSSQSENVYMTHFDEVLSLTLETVGNLLTWIPLDGYKVETEEHYPKTVPFPEVFIEVICQYAHLNTCPNFVSERMIFDEYIFKMISALTLNVVCMYVAVCCVSIIHCFHFFYRQRKEVNLEYFLWEF